MLTSMLELGEDDAPHIRVLPPEVAEQIAAGEIVERPASVVRELVDNAIDAGASDVAVDVRGGGLSLIRVADNGTGIPAAEVELAFARHATSKIRHVDDLSRLRTLGFRGEALPSIAAVAEVILATRQSRASVGTLVEVRAGQVIRREQTARQAGTTVAVRQLFFNVPARLKLVGAGRSESARVAQLVRRFALARPTVRLALTVDGRTVFRSRGEGDVRGIVADSLGSTVAGALRPLAGSTPDGTRLGGFISTRTTTQPDRRHITLVVNGRLTATPGLLEALESAYRPLLPRGRHPFALVQLELPPAGVDPNVHPAKAEVRLLGESGVAQMLVRAVRAALGEAADRPRDDADFSLAPGQLALAQPRRSIAEAPARWWGAGGSQEGLLKDALHATRSFSQLHDSLIVAETETGVFLVDQHRAHERVIYESLQGRAERAGYDAGAQTLLEPVVLELGPTQAAQLDDRLPLLHALGFDCQRFGGRDFLVRAVPAVVPPGEDVGALVQQLLEEASAPDDRWQDRLMARLACRAAVKRHSRLTEAEMRTLLDELATAASPAACPHGSPVVLHLTAEFLKRQFRW